MIRAEHGRDARARFWMVIDIFKAISMVSFMKTTLVIEESILKKAKAHAAAYDTTVSELVNRSLRSYLQASQSLANEPRIFAMPVFGQAAQTAAGVSPAQLADLRDDGR